MEESFFGFRPGLWALRVEEGRRTAADESTIEGVILPKNVMPGVMLASSLALLFPGVGNTRN